MKSILNWLIAIVAVWFAYCCISTFVEREATRISALPFKQSCVNEGGYLRHDAPHLYCELPDGNEKQYDGDFNHEQLFIETALHKATFHLLT